MRKIYLSTNLDQRFYGKFIIMGFFLMVYSIAAVIISQIIQAVPFTFSTGTPTQTLALLLSITTAFVGLMSFSFGVLFNVRSETLGEIQLNYNYNVLKKKVKSDELPKLKALLILKSRHPDFLLKSFYHKDDSLSDEYVSKLLYENPSTKY